MERLTGHKNTFKNKTGMTLSSIIEKEYDFLKDNFENLSVSTETKSLIRYRLLCKEVFHGILLGVPLKNTTLIDKKKQIKNFE